MPNKTYDELKQIGIDLYSDKIFTTQHLLDIQDINIVFPMLTFLDEENLNYLEKQDVSVFFEYKDKASTLSVNNYPIFYSYDMLTFDEWDIVCDVYNKLTNLTNAILTNKE